MLPLKKLNLSCENAEASFDGQPVICLQNQAMPPQS